MPPYKVGQQYPLSIPVITPNYNDATNAITPHPGAGHAAVPHILWTFGNCGGARGRSRTGTALRPGDFKSPAATNYATRAVITGGGGRNRTGVHGFAGRCMTTLPPRRKKQKGKTAGLTGGRFPRIWSGKGVSNSRPQPWQGCALPTELFPRFVRKIIGQRALPWQLFAPRLWQRDLEVVRHRSKREYRRKINEPGAYLYRAE